MKGKEDHGPGVEYPRWISEELIDETSANLRPKRRTVPSPEKRQSTCWSVWACFLM